VSAHDPVERQTAPVLIRRERAGDVDAVDAVHRAAFPTAVEAELLAALRADAGWRPELSMVAEGATGDVVGHVACTDGRLGERPVLGLGPIGVLPDRQHGGVGSALLHAVLGGADALGEPVVVLLGSREYYPRFGFVPASSLGIGAPDPGWGDHFQARPLSAWAPELAGPFRYAAPFEAL
jgi:putative acetyltransferase